MNKFIAETFAGVLSLMHLFVILAIIYAIFKYQKHQNELVEIFGPLAYDKTYFYLILLAIFVIYVLLMGALSTLVSINEKLDSITEGLSKLDKN